MSRADEPGKPAKRPALSPSRAADFKQCPLLYRFRAIDRLPEPPSTAQLRGSVVHAALEQLYGLPAAQRGPQTVDALVGPAWEQIIADEPELADQLDAEQQSNLLDEARKLLSGYYRLEDPTRFDPQSCEQRIEVELADGTLLRGIIDRIDVAPTGELRVVDYKTGKAPPDEVLRGRVTALTRGASDPAAPHLPRRRPAAGLLPRRSRAVAFREDVDGDLAGHSICRCHRRFPAAAVAAV
jgi:putative RecB family exonuclease